MKQTMENQNFNTQIIINKPAIEVFNAINNVRGWWSENIQGSTEKLDDEFIYQYQDVHVCKMKIIESVPGRKIVWKVLENQFNFTNDKNEWKGNEIVFRISEKDGRTQLDFTQTGLVPAYECYNVCRDAWSSYIQGSLKNLIETGKGKPNTKENDLNRELVEKWGLPNITGTKSENFSYVFNTSKTPDEVFQLLLDVKQWWFGLFEETITGNSHKVNDEFMFKAGGGIHNTKQRLVELIPDKKVAWLVTESNLTFLKDASEWNGTIIRFDIDGGKDGTKVIFTHEGLVPQIECFGSCSGAWTAYLDQLKRKLE